MDFKFNTNPEIDKGYQTKFEYNKKSALSKNQIGSTDFLDSLDYGLLKNGDISRSIKSKTYSNSINLNDAGINALNALKKLRMSEIERYKGIKGNKYAQNKNSKKVNMVESSINLTN